MKRDSAIVRHEQCPRCASQGRDSAADNLAVFESGHASCIACGYKQYANKPYEKEEMTGQLQFSDLPKLRSTDLPLRGISADVAAEFGVKTEHDESTGAHLRYYFPLYAGSTLKGWQWREAKAPGEGAKTGRVGDSKRTLPFGAHLMGTGGRFVIVTEAGEDALAVREMLNMQGKHYRVVSTLGTGGWKANLDWFEKFDTVVIAFDQDDAGREQANAFASALTPGKARIAAWDDHCKGPGDLLLKAESPDEFFMSAINNAKPVQVSGVVRSSETWDLYKARKDQEFIPYPPEWTQLCRMCYGLRMGEVSTWTGPTGGGKTSLLRELDLHILKTTKHRIGIIELEASVGETLQGLMGLVLNKRIGLPDVHVTEQEERDAWTKLCANDRLVFLDHRGEFDGPKILAMIRYLVYAMNCTVVRLDSITLALANDGDGNGPMDVFTKELAKIVKNRPVHVALVAHTRKTGAGHKSFEEGAVAADDDLKGSGSLKQTSFDIIAIARDKVAESDVERNTNTLWVRKCRATGRSGRADALLYDDTTGRLTPVAQAPAPQATAGDF